VEVGDARYVVDFGMGTARQMTLALLSDTPPHRTMSRMRAGFITHLHSDHVLDLANVVFSGMNQGWPDAPVPIYGPGPSSGHLSGTGITKQVDPGITGFDSTAPGTSAMVAALETLLAADLHERVVRQGRRPVRDMVFGEDVSVPDGHQVWPVYEDERVRVSATLVDHGEMRPAFGYRFDTDGGSVVFSGDTAPSSDLIELARGADILIHEAIHESIGELMFGPGPMSSEGRDVLRRVMAKHTHVDEVGAVAQSAEVATLVLSHLVPASAPDRVWIEGVRGFDGRVVLGRDLMELPFGNAVR
jgi:ribonuclease BN (tRNA processing enzyme)